MYTFVTPFDDEVQPLQVTRTSRKEIYGRLAALVRRVRKEKGLSQHELSVALGQGPKYVWRLERGRSFVHFIEFLDLMNELGVDPSEAVAEILGRREFNR